MMKEEFMQWMIKKESKKETTAYQYSRSIDKISEHYRSNTGKEIDIYREQDIMLLQRIAYEYSQQGRFSDFGNKGKGTNRNAITTYVRFLNDKYDNSTTSLPQDYHLDNITEAVNFPEGQFGITNFTYERDLKNALAFQAENLFPGYKVFGFNREGIEYSVDGKKVDLLLENLAENSLLAVEIKAGIADYRVFGQISMYLGLLSKNFPDKIVKGLIIASEVDESLVNASSITDKVGLKTYTMELSLQDVI